MPSSARARMQSYFDRVAPAYARRIAPVFAQLGQSMIEAADPQAGDSALDLGSGPGLLSSELRARGLATVAFDLSRAMLMQAPVGLLRVQGDLVALPFPGRHFDLIFAGFALNSSDPQPAMIEAARVLKTGGRFLALEWGEEDDLSALLADTIAEYAIDSAPPGLAALRAGAEAPLPWDDLEDIDHLGRMATVAGLQLDRCEAISLPVGFESVADFIRFKCAWPLRAAELDAMSPAMRRLCMAEIEEGLSAHCDDEGRLWWRPSVVQLFATKSD